MSGFVSTSAVLVLQQKLFTGEEPLSVLCFKKQKKTTKTKKRLAVHFGPQSWVFLTVVGQPFDFERPVGVPFFPSCFWKSDM